MDNSEYGEKITLLMLSELLILIFQLQSKRTRKDFAETVKEGESYGEELEIGGVDNEAIPSKVQLTGKESCVVYDLETTGMK